MKDYSKLIIRWTLGRTKARPLSLQAWDMLECSIKFAQKLFPKAEFMVFHNNLTIMDQSNLNRIEELGVFHEDMTNKAPLGNLKKNSFWKYYPLRVDSNKYELLLDNDIVLWEVPNALQQWLDSSNGLLINTDWNGAFYGDYEHLSPQTHFFNAGILGFPPEFTFSLPDYSSLHDLFHTEQGFIVKTFLEAGQPLFILNKEEMYQSNNSDSEKYQKVNITELFSGGHFCGCTYAHYNHWDKYYKEEIWLRYYGQQRT